MPALTKAMPKYMQISRRIAAKIRSGELAAGALVPSENDIISRYDVSNTTARKALHELERTGWVQRIKARGTFVRANPVGRSADRILGFTRNMSEAGRTPSTKLLNVSIRRKGRALTLNGRRYRLPGPICVIDRLRFADGQPMMKERRYINLALCPRIDRKDLGQSLYRIYEEDYQLHLSEVSQVLSAITLEEPDDLSLFDLSEPVPAFLVEGVTFCGRQLILEMEKSIYRGDMYRFTVTATPQPQGIA